MKIDRVFFSMAPLAALAMFTACGDTEDGGASEVLTGTVLDTRFTVASSAFVYDHSEGADIPIAIVLTDAPDACAALAAGDVHLEFGESGSDRRLKNTTVITILFAGADSPGTYNFDFERDVFALAQLSKTGDDCAPLITDERAVAKMGNVTLTSADPREGGKAIGRLDLVFPENTGVLFGEFEAPYCATTNKSAVAMCR